MAKKPSPVDATLAATMELAAERGWRSLSLADISDRSGVALADLVEQFPSKAAILAAYTRSVDARMLAAGTETGETPRDRLFDVIMRRFEAMAPDRRGLAAILRQAGDDPLLLVCGARRFVQSMALTLEAAGLSSSGLWGMIRLKGLAAIYLYTMRVFVEDDSPDLTRTMAALDKALRRVESVAVLLWRRSPDLPPPPQPVEGEL